MKTLAAIAVFLAAMNICLAIGIVYSKHLSRQKNIELSEIQAAIDDLDIEWSRLQIEESTFSEHGIVETIARQRLRMRFPSQETTVMIAR